ncbi:MAG: hypothetical protein WCL21_04390 [Mariniphaga sp.]
MGHVTLKVALLLILLTLVIGNNSQGAASSVRPPGKKCEITFGESYHHYLPGSIMRMNVDFKNSASDNLKVSQELVLLDSLSLKVWKTVINLELLPYSRTAVPLIVPIPKQQGSFKLTISDQGGGDSVPCPSFTINVIQPKKSARLSKILVHTPDWEDDINRFLKVWDIKAPTISWGQVLLFGKKGWARFAAGDPEITQLISRALRREMSVIFIDVRPAGQITGKQLKINLPYGISMNFIEGLSAEHGIVLKPQYKELNYLLRGDLMRDWNGLSGELLPGFDMQFEGKGVKINAYANAGKDLSRTPVIEMIPQSGKGKLYLSQIITEGRIDVLIKPPRNKPELPAYDPIAVQFLLNLISATVGDNLLK